MRKKGYNKCHERINCLFRRALVSCILISADGFIAKITPVQDRFWEDGCHKVELLSAEARRWGTTLFS